MDVIFIQFILTDFPETTEYLQGYGSVIPNLISAHILNHLPRVCMNCTVQVNMLLGFYIITNALTLVWLFVYL